MLIGSFTSIKSDHSVISFKYQCYLDFSKPKVIFNYEKGDFYGMRNNLIASINGRRNIYHMEIVEELWLDLKTKLIELRNQYVPRKTISGKASWRKKGCVPISKPLQKCYTRQA